MRRLLFARHEQSESDTRAMTGLARVAAVQFEPALLRKEENIVALLRLAEEGVRKIGTPPPADSAPTGLIVLPEMATTGYVFRSREEIAPYVEPIPGPTTRVFGRLARRWGVSLVVGLAEVDPSSGAFYNSAALIGPDGQVAGVYRKTHSFCADTFWAAEGDLGLPVFTGAWPGPLGVLICMDVGFFETARVMALDGARILAVPTNWLRMAPNPEWRARAAENGIHIVVADRWGEERGTRFAGGSCVIGPRGEILASRDRGDGVITAEIDLGWAEPGVAAAACTGSDAATGAGARSDAATAPRDSTRFVRRRPDLYHTLLRHPYRWPERYCFGDLGSGRFWLGAAPGPADRILGQAVTAASLPGEPGRRLIVLPPGHGAKDLDRLAGAAKAAGVYLAASLGPAGIGRRGSAAAGNHEEIVLLGPEGILGRYRSPHGPPPSGERARFPVWDQAMPGGEPFPVFDLPFARVGLLHPLDLLLPEPPRILAKQGVDVVLVSGFWPNGLSDLEFLWAERAETNDIWLAIAVEGKAAVYASDARGEKAVLPGISGAGPAETGRRPPGPFEEVGTDAAGCLTGLLAVTGPGTFTRRKDRVRRLRPELYLKLVAPGRRTSGLRPE
jgi:predicted amidohydrolase